MEPSEPPLRETKWYSLVWRTLLIGSGLWTGFGAFISFQLLFVMPHGLSALNALPWEAFLVLSLPVFALFFLLLIYRPRVPRQP